MDLADHFRVIWLNRWRVLLASAAIAIAVFAWSSTRPAVYRAKAVISVTAGRALSGESAKEQDTVFLTRNYAELARTQPVLAQAALKSRLHISASDAGARITVVAASDVGFLTISADDSSDKAATVLAGAVADALIDATREQQAETLRQSLAPVEEEIRQLESRLADLSAVGGDRAALETRYSALLQAATDRRLAPTDRLALVAPARADLGPVSPKPRRSTALAFLAALVVNSELAVLAHALKDTFSREEQDVGADTVAGLPVLGRLPIGAEGDALEAFRTLRTNLMFMDTSDSIRTVAVVSADPGTGKTYSSVHLAKSVAALDVEVILIDADLRRPNVHLHLGVEVSPGLSDLLAGAAPDVVLRPAPGVEHLRLVTGGEPVADPAGQLAARRFSDVLDRLNWAAMVIVDTPASSLFADALAIASRCDATLLVVDARTTRRQTVRTAVRQFNQVGANIIGLVLNRTEPLSRTAYGYDRPPAETEA